MKLFCKEEKRSICRECGVFFEPREDNWKDLCKTHAKPGMERAARYKVVKNWFERHWEEFEERAKLEEAEMLKKQSEALQMGMSQMAAAQTSMSPYGGALSGLGGISR